MTIFLFLITFSIWAAVHSVMASTGFKQTARRRMGHRRYEGFYRLIYNVLSVISFLPVLVAAAALLPTGRLWTMPWPISLVFAVIQITGLVGLLAALYQTDVLHFAGLGQAIRYLQGLEQLDPEPRLVIAGTYKLVRHPIYFFSLLILWFVPLMTWPILIFNLAATAYFWIGSGYEERRLTAEFGEAYRQYQRRVPRLLPRLVPVKTPGSG